MKIPARTSLTINKIKNPIGVFSSKIRISGKEIHIVSHTMGRLSSGLTHYDFNKRAKISCSTSYFPHLVIYINLLYVRNSL